MMRPAAVLAAAVLLAAGPAGAGTTWKVGPEGEFKSLEEVARVVREGDTVELAPGEYFDCAVWRVGNLTITGPTDPATPAVISDRPCQGKAAFVVVGGGVTVRHLTFTRIRVPDGNGAGIRAEGPDLTVTHSRFVNNQVGILAADMGAGSLTILDSHFERNGACQGERCLATVQAGQMLRLRIERTTLTDARGGDLVRAAAQRSDLIDSQFTDGPQGRSGRLVLLQGGAVLATGNTFQKGPQSAGPEVAVQILDLYGPGAPAVFQRNTVVNETGRSLTFVRNLSRGTVRLDGNVLSAGTVALDDSGYWTARARGLARSVIDDVRWALGTAKGLAVKVVRKLGL